MSGRTKSNRIPLKGAAHSVSPVPSAAGTSSTPAA
jgi:hypothetical protein